MKSFSISLIICLFFVANVTAENKVSKQVCLSTLGMKWKTSEEAKQHLLISAKREAVGELFGEVIRGITKVEDGRLTKDEIEQVSSGLIRIDGNPLFFQGKDFGELCVKIDAYITDEDINRLSPRRIEKKVCISDPRLSLGAVRKTAEQQARIQALRNYEPKLEEFSDEAVLSLIHESKTIEAGFIPDTEVYCVKASGTVYPIELMAIVEKPQKKKNEKINRWDVSSDKVSWKSVSLPDTRWGCDDCTRFYRTVISGVPINIKFRWASDNKARLWLNNKIVFDEFWRPNYCTDKPCCSKCCDNPSNRRSGLSSWYNLDLSKFSNELSPQNYLIWEVYEEWGGEGFYTEMEVSYY